jgi:hypothetical protein
VSRSRPSLRPPRRAGRFQNVHQLDSKLTRIPGRLGRLWRRRLRTTLRLEVEGVLRSQNLRVKLNRELGAGENRAAIVLFHGIVIDALEAARARQACSLAQSRKVFPDSRSGRGTNATLHCRPSACVPARSLGNASRFHSEGTPLSAISVALGRTPGYRADATSPSASNARLTRSWRSPSTA